MKARLYLAVITSIMLVSCSPEKRALNEIQTGTAAPSPGAGMVIIKFANPQQLNYVVASHALERYDGFSGCYLYDESGSLGLNIVDGRDDFLTFNPTEHTPFFENVLKLLGTSPYISLGNDYYLIDWKWQQLLPISATCNYPQPDRGDIMDAILNHCFLTSTKWKDLKSVSTRFPQSNSYSPILVSEVYRLNIKAFEKHLGVDTSNRSDFLCYNYSLYSEGLSVVNVMSYWVNGSSSDCHSQDAYKDCIEYYDRLQNMYVKELTQIIAQGKLNKIPLSR